MKRNRNFFLKCWLFFTLKCLTFLTILKCCGVCVCVFVWISPILRKGVNSHILGEGVRKINRTNTISIITTSGVLFVAILFVYQTVQLILHFRNFKGCCVGYFLNSTNNLCESKSFQLILIYKVREVIIINIIVF